MPDIETTIKALNSKTRREILRILAKGPKTVKEIHKLLKSNININLRYRESVLKALGKLVDAELVEKYYEKDKGILYRLKKKQITIDLSEGKVK
jgi:DNA-binding transcriptional ArsR family regulator